jgi:hypothetical protein
MFIYVFNIDGGKLRFVTKNLHAIFGLVIARENTHRT